MLFIALILFQYSIPYDSPITQYIEYMQTQGQMDIPMIRPYRLHWIQPQLDSIIMNDQNLSRTDQQVLSLLAPIITKHQKFSPFFHLYGTYENDPEYYGGFLDYRGGGTLCKHISFSHGMRFQRSSEIDSFGPKPWRDFQVSMTEGLVRFNAHPIEFLLGRSNYLFGYGDASSIFLSQEHQAYDGCALFIPAGMIEFYTLFTVLNAHSNRYLTVHRLGIHFGKLLSIGFSESLLFANTLEPLYFNFLLPYYLTQWGINRDDNIQWCIDARIKAFNIIFFSEFLIDDYMFENDPYPHKLGWKAGFSTVLIDRLYTKFTYIFIDKWVYTHEYTWNIHEKDGLPLGFPLGNDVDRLRFSITYINPLYIHPSFRFEYIRKGEGSIYLPYEIEGGDWNPPFPSGIVEKTMDLRIGLEYVIKKNLYVQGQIGQMFQENIEHVLGDDEDRLVFNISLWVIY